MGDLEKNSVGFDVSGFNQFFPACKFSRLVSRELLRCVRHNLEAQVEQLGFDLWVIQPSHDGSVQLGFDLSRQTAWRGNGLP